MPSTHTYMLSNRYGHEPVALRVVRFSGWGPSCALFDVAEYAGNGDALRRSKTTGEAIPLPIQRAAFFSGIDQEWPL